MVPKKKRVVNKDLLSKVRSMPCVICGHRPSDACHVKTVKSGGPDLEFNIFPACRQHHSEQHQKGFAHMACKYARFFDWLVANGWCWENGKFVNAKLYSN